MFFDFLLNFLTFALWGTFSSTAYELATLIFYFLSFGWL